MQTTNSRERIKIFNQETEGKALLYEGGTLAQMRVSEKNFQEKIGYRNDLDALIEMHGYVKFAQLGPESLFRVEAYRVDAELASLRPEFQAPYKFLIDINFNGNHQVVFVEQYPVLLELFSELAPIASFVSTD